MEWCCTESAGNEAREAVVTGVAERRPRAVAEPPAGSNSPTMSTPSARWIPFLALVFASCIFVVKDGDWDGSSWSHSVRGSGVRAEVDRQVAEFRAIELGTCAKVLVEVGVAPSVHLSGDDNLLPKVKTRVENGTLSIDLPGSCNFRCGLELVIGTPALERFAIEGSGDVTIHDLAADQVKLAIEGSGTLCAHGTVRSLNGSIDGSGTLGLSELAADNADLSIEGSGSMEVHVAKVLHYSIEGSGEIRYVGEPELGGQIEGSGSVEKSR
jgi:autotransporter translocation and assembly factor TamB